MPKQELFFEQVIAGTRIEVLKSYDRHYAYEAFKEMDEEALRHLWKTLKPEEIYEASELPDLGQTDGDGETFLWDELLDQAREDGNLLSFFVVNRVVGARSRPLYVSADWPSAEGFAKQKADAIQ